MTAVALLALLPAWAEEPQPPAPKVTVSLAVSIKEYDPFTPSKGVVKITLRNAGDKVARPRPARRRFRAQGALPGRLRHRQGRDRPRAGDADRQAEQAAAEAVNPPRTATKNLPESPRSHPEKRIMAQLKNVVEPF